MALRKVLGVFAVTSLLMWAFPIAVLQLFNRNLIPGMENLSPRSRTLWSGGLAVLSVNFVTLIYIVLALREPSVVAVPQPDLSFTSRANASLAETARHQTGHEAEERSKSD